MTKEQLTIHVGIDVSKDKLAVAIAGGGVRDEVLILGWTCHGIVPVL